MFPRDSRPRAVATPIRRALLLLTVATLLACTGVVTARAAAPSPPRSAGGAVPDRYIVVLRDDIAQAAERVASEKSQQLGLEVSQTYRHALKGFAARIPVGRLDDVRADDRVAYVEKDKIVTATEQALPRSVDKIEADQSSTLAGDGSGEVSNVNAYIIDTGIDQDHPDLNVVEHVNFHGKKNKDCNGHGTHVAGTVAASDNTRAVVGVVPGAPLTGVKVLGCKGWGWTSNVIKGIEWVTVNAKKPAIANMSLGGGASQALDDAVKNSADSGVFYSVAAGNSGRDACEQSPARAGRTRNPNGTWEKDNGVVTIAATNSSDEETSWSNYGSCVDIWAPGANILSTKLGGGTTTLSGTSMASPHVGGTGALYLSRHLGSTPSAAETALKTDAVATGAESKNGDPIKRVYAGGY